MNATSPASGPSRPSASRIFTLSSRFSHTWTSRLPLFSTSMTRSWGRGRGLARRSEGSCDRQTTTSSKNESSLAVTEGTMLPETVALEESAFGYFADGMVTRSRYSGGKHTQQGRAVVWDPSSLRDMPFHRQTNSTGQQLWPLATSLYNTAYRPTM